MRGRKPKPTALKFLDGSAQLIDPTGPPGRANRGGCGRSAPVSPEDCFPACVECRDFDLDVISGAGDRVAPPLALRLSGVGLVLPPNWPRPRIWATLPAVEALHDHTASRPHSRQNGPACRWPGNPIDPSAPGSGNDPQDLDQAGAPSWPRSDRLHQAPPGNVLRHHGRFWPGGSYTAPGRNHRPE